MQGQMHPTLAERIICDENILAGKPVIKGTRLAVEFIVGLLAHGWTEAEVLENYPHIVQADIRACLAYANVEQAKLSVDKLITCDAEIMSGTPVFKNTRVPIKNLIDYLETGESLDEFLEDFPSVSREQAIQILALAREVLLTHAYANSHR